MSTTNKYKDLFKGFISGTPSQELQPSEVSELSAVIFVYWIKEGKLPTYNVLKQIWNKRFDEG